MIALFVLKLSAGITVMWLLMPRREVTDGFFRIQMRLLLGTTVLTALLLTRSTTWPEPAGARAVPAGTPQSGTVRSGDLTADDVTVTDVSSQVSNRSVVQTESGSAFTTAERIRWLQILAAVIAYPGSIFWALGRRKPGNVCIWLLAVICCSCVVLHSVSVPSLAAIWLQMASDMASILVLGAMLTAMLLGHWYLTTPSMSIRPLWWFARTLLIVAVLRLTLSGMTLWQFGFSEGGLTHGIWLALRWTGGGVVPAVVALLMRRILNYRNTQSATGVLFAGLILVFMGEMTAALLERDVQIPY